MTRRFWIGLALTLPVLALDMGQHLLGLDLVPRGTANWIQLTIATPVVLWAGWPFFVRGWRSVVSRNLNMFTLIAMGTGVAWLYSLVATLTPGIFPSTFRDHHGVVGVYFEAATVITVLVLLGQVLELRAREHSSGAIKALLKLTPNTARRISADGANPKWRSIQSLWASDSACDQAKKCRSMARFSKAALRSTSRWLPANPCRSTKLRATR